MEQSEVLRLYDLEYAESYNDNFLLGTHFIECTEFELGLIGQMLTPTSSWLDVACGMGYFLSQFPGVNRMGLDLSPAMLAIARAANPGMPFAEGSFEARRNEWVGKWDLVSCTWYAYCYAQTVESVERLISNLTLWTAKDGNCFFPVCDPDVLCKTTIPRTPPADSDDGTLSIDGVGWTWTDLPTGRKHRNLIAPHLDHLLAAFGRHFAENRIVEYPLFENDCMAARKAIVASGRV